MVLIKCEECDKKISDKAKDCPKCGHPLKEKKVNIENKKKKTTATLWCFFLGGIGAHKFYLEKTLQGVLYLLFCWTWIPAIIAIIEFFLFLFMSEKDFDERYNNSNNNNEKKSTSVLSTIVIIFFGLVFIGFLIGFTNSFLDSEISNNKKEGINNYKNPNSELETIKLSTLDLNSIKKYDYRELIRNPETYKNEIMYLEGKIIQIQESLGKKYARVDISKEEFDFEGKVIWFEFTNEKLIEGDKIVGYFQGNGIETYKAVLGNEITIPKGKFVYIYNFDSGDSFSFNNNLIIDINILDKIDSSSLLNGEVSNSESKESFEYISNLSNSELFIGLIDMSFENKGTWGKIKAMNFYIENYDETIYDLGILIEVGEKDMSLKNYNDKLIKLVDYMEENEKKKITIDVDLSIPKIENIKIVKLSLSDNSYYYTSLNTRSNFNFNFNNLK